MSHADITCTCIHVVYAAISGRIVLARGAWVLLGCGALEMEEDDFLSLIDEGDVGEVEGGEAFEMR